MFKKNVLFLGVPDMGLIGLDTFLYAGVNIVGVVGPPKTHNTYTMFKNFVKSRNQNFIEYDSLDSPDFIKKIEALNPDIGVVFSFNNKIPNVLIDIVKDGIINIHPSLLPNYRGGNPYSWVIINNEKKTGVTLHYISENFDEGDIIAQEECDIFDHDTMGTIFDKTNNLACKMVLKTLMFYERGMTLPRTVQAAGDYIKAPNIKEKDLFIDYNKDACYIERFVRALNPYLSPMTIYKNQPVKIHKVSISSQIGYENFKNGQICAIMDNKIHIKTANGCIVPEIVQVSGLFIGDSADFIKIIRPEIGDEFTNG